MPPGGTRAARIRAARAYAGLTPPELAKALGWSPRTLHRVETGEKVDVTDALPALADATGVPLAFFQEGFHEAGDANMKVSDLRATVTTLAVDLLRVRQELQELRDRDRREPPQEGDR